MARLSTTLGIGCGFLTLGGMCLTSFACQVIWPMAAEDAATGFLSDVRTASWSSALQRTSRGFQEHHDDAELASAVGRIPLLARHTAASISNATMGSDQALLDGTLDTPEGSVPVGVELVYAEGYWYVDHLVVRGVPLE